MRTQGGIGRDRAWALTQARAIAFLALLSVACQLHLPGADSPQPAPAAPPPPAGCWDAAQAEKLEKSLDEFFAEPDAAKRAQAFASALEPLQPGLSLEELESIAKAVPPAGEKKGHVWRVQAPWLKDNPRGWLNVSIPKDYSPKKTWGLVVALHGSGSDGDNLPSFYSPQMNDAGYFVIYPTTTAVANFWSTPAEMANVYRLVEWMGRNYRIDFRRLVVTGGSMGGMGTWSHLLARPELWSVGASVAGHPAALEGEIFEKLRGIPFYILHGEKDTNGASLAPVEHVRLAVEELKKRKLDYVYVEEPGAGHTPSMKYWQEMNAWIAKQAPKAFSPRPLFLPLSGERALWQRAADPAGLQDDPALALMKSGKFADAKKDLDERIAKTPGDAKSYMLRAVANVPALAKPLPDNLDPAALKDGNDGWGALNEANALRDLDAALRAKDGKGDDAKGFDANVDLMIAKVWARRFAVTVPSGGTSWVAPYQTYVKALQESLKLNMSNPEAVRLAQAMNAKLPRK